MKPAEQARLIVRAAEGGAFRELGLECELGKSEREDARNRARCLAAVESLLGERVKKDAWDRVYARERASGITLTSLDVTALGWAEHAWSGRRRPRRGKKALDAEPADG